MKYIFTSIILLLLAGAGYGQKHKLGLNLVKGSTYYTVSSTTSKIKQTINGQENNIGVIITGRISFKVLNANDSLYFMEVAYKNVGLKMQLPTGMVSFESEKKDSTDIMSAILHGMVDKPFTATINWKGRIRAVDNVENMIASVLDGFPQLQGPQKDQIKAKFVESFGGTAIKTSLESSMAIYPDNAVAKNDKWLLNTRLQTTMSAATTTNYQLTDITPTGYTIHGDGIISTNDNDDYKTISGMPMKYHMKGTVISDIRVDKVTGWITESHVKQDLSGTVSIKDNQQVPGGVTFPMTMSAETVITDK